MSSEVPTAIDVAGVGKCYRIYARPQDRLKQALLSRWSSLTGSDEKRLFREHWALRDVTFRVPKGGTVGIIGRNGSGKSTLLQTICGTLSPTQGRVEVEGRIAALLELGTGFNPEFTGRENIFLNAAILGLSQEQIRERFDRIVAFAEIGEFIDQPVKTYSSGMYVRLAFAVIAHVDADILVIDEALAVGDFVFAQKCMRFLRGFMNHGTVLFVSHDVNSVLNLCDTAIWMHEGAVRMVGPAKSVVDAYSRECMQRLAGDSVEYRSINGIAGSGTSIEFNNVEREVTATFFDNILNSDGWTSGAAELISAEIYDMSGRRTSTFHGGERILLRICAMAGNPMGSVIIGFLLKDRLGQPLFGEHTYAWSGGVPVDAAQRITAEFEFDLPLLPNGEYSMTISIADGSPHEHVQHHWLHNAALLKVSSNKERHGLVGIPFRNVSLRTDES